MIPILILFIVSLIKKILLLTSISTTGWLSFKILNLDFPSFGDSVLSTKLEGSPLLVKFKEYLKYYLDYLLKYLAPSGEDDEDDSH
jgi:hypothetical protein